MEEAWELDLKQNIEQFLNSLQSKSNFFKFSPALDGVTNSGENLSLGFSCYALKCFYMLGLWEKIDKNIQNEWSNYINSYQKSIKGLPSNSYIDLPIVNFYNSSFNKFSLKNFVKKILNNLEISSKRTTEEQFVDTIKAETKQAISTLYQVGFVNNKKYNDFPQTKESINDYLDSLNWEKPWNAGAQFSALCVFTATQLEDELKERNELILYTYLDRVLNNKSGFYHISNKINQKEKINGAMKVITGLDWINKPIHNPEKIIDYCLSIEPEADGCDIVDLVYVMYKSTIQSSYREKDVGEFFTKIKSIIKKNYHSNIGAFSYFEGKSQLEYYGLKISKGLNTPDIHGTTLLLWAMTMIYDFQGIDQFNVIKP